MSMQLLGKLPRGHYLITYDLDGEPSLYGDIHPADPIIPVTPPAVAKPTLQELRNQLTRPMPKTARARLQREIAALEAQTG